MPNRISQDKARALALEYCTNGRKKGEAMETIGYKHSYAVSAHRLKTYDNVLVKAEIARLDRKIELQTLKTQFTRTKSEAELDRALAIAEAKHDASAMTGAIRAKNKLYGLEIDTRLDVKIDAGRRPPDSEVARERSIARTKAITGANTDAEDSIRLP